MFDAHQRFFQQEVRGSARANCLVLQKKIKYATSLMHESLIYAVCYLVAHQRQSGNVSGSRFINFSQSVISKFLI